MVFFPYYCCRDAEAVASQHDVGEIRVASVTVAWIDPNAQGGLIPKAAHVAFCLVTKLRLKSFFAMEAWVCSCLADMLKREKNTY